MELFEIKKHEAEIHKKVNQICFERQEHNMLYLPMEYVDQHCRMIVENKKEELVEVFTSGKFKNTTGKLSSSEILNMKFQLVSLMAICTTRLVSEHLVDNNISHAIVDATIQCLEKSNDLKNVAEIGLCGILILMDEVQKYKSGGVPALVRRAENYIFSHLHDNLSLNMVASELAVNPEHLTTIFRQHTGMSVKQYILSLKMEQARNLLIFSDYSIQEIANYLEFSDSSHFGRIFKKRMGMTPQQYRNRNVSRCKISVSDQ